VTTDAKPSKFSQYRAMVSPMAAAALRGAPEPHDGVALGVGAAVLLLEDDASRYAALPAGLHALASCPRPPMLADPSGHRRDVYFPFVLHLHLRAFALRYESMPTGVWTACEDVLPAAVDPVREAEDYADRPPPPERAALTLWQALCLAEFADVTRRDVDVEVADAVAHQIAARPGADGTFHPRSPDQSLDAWTYRELCGMHALAGLALLRRNRTWASRVEQIGRYHQEHTQPDYTTTQPWGVFAGLWSPTTDMFAQQQLHDTASAQATASDEYARHLAMIGMLLADAADALARFD
jgi:hypothetical protein